MTMIFPVRRVCVCFLLLIFCAVLCCTIAESGVTCKTHLKFFSNHFKEDDNLVDDIQLQC